MIAERLRQGDRVLDLLQKEYPGYHPLIGVAKIAHRTEDDRLEFDCHKVLCEYIEPKLKSIEVSTALPEDAVLKVFFDGDCEEIIKDGASAPILKKLPVDELLDSETPKLELEVKVA